MSLPLTRRDIITLLKDKNPPIKPSKDKTVYKEHVESAILQYFGLYKENLKTPGKFSGYCSKFAYDGYEYYSNESGSKIDEFLKSERRKSWLDAIIERPDAIEVKAPKRSHPGAPKKAFCDKGATAQNLEAHDVKNYASCSAAVFKAAKFCADKEGLKDVSFVYKEVIKDPAKATEMREAITAPKKGIS